MAVRQQTEVILMSDMCHFSADVHLRHPLLKPIERRRPRICAHFVAALVFEMVIFENNPQNLNYVCFFSITPSTFFLGNRAVVFSESLRDSQIQRALLENTALFDNCAKVLLNTSERVIQEPGIRMIPRSSAKWS
jgi:hypothetical protein